MAARRRIGRALENVSGTLDQYLRYLLQQQLWDERQREQTGRTTLSTLLQYTDPELLPDLLPEIAQGLTSGDVSGIVGKLPIRRPRPEERLAPLFEEYSGATTPEAVAGVTPETVASRVMSAGVPFLKPEMRQPGQTTPPQPNMEALRAWRMLSDLVQGKQKALGTPGEYAETMTPTGGTQREFQPRSSTAPLVTGLPPMETERLAMQARSAAETSPEAQLLADVEATREASAAGQRRGAEEAAATPEILKRQAATRAAEQAAELKKSHTAQQKTQEGLAAGAESMMENVDLLLSPLPGPEGQRYLSRAASKVVGPARLPAVMAREVGGKVSSTQAIIDQLVGQQILALMAELKAQSKTGATGFGQLSEKELAILQQASTRLSNQAQSEEDYAKSLQDLKASLQRIIFTARGVGMTTASGKPIRVVR